jgi:hypothetical protein
VLKAERDLLCTLSFDLNVEHPYQYIMPFLAAIQDERVPQLADGRCGAPR